MPIVHFIISLGIAFALEINYTRRYLLILSLGIIGILPDIDHIIPSLGGAGILHNTFFLGILPLALFMGAYMIEDNRSPDSSKLQRYMVCVTVILLGHLLLDLIAGNTVSLNIFSGSAAFSFESVPLIEISGMRPVLMSADILWVGLMFLILMGNITQKRIYEIAEGFAEYEAALEPVKFTREEILRAIIASPELDMVND
jgi:hypothetical protein